jgi:hypothetical protein
LLHAELTEIAEAPSQEWPMLLAQRREGERETTINLEQLQEEGEELSLAIARAGEAARLDALDAEHRGSSLDTSWARPLVKMIPDFQWTTQFAAVVFP